MADVALPPRLHVTATSQMPPQPFAGGARTDFDDFGESDFNAV
uniref:PH01B001I13.21 protein n=1 Tax=Phyllostachys edulis TaxID=38705 RepID=L0P204_PHYED|nr:PH01B001I13.21 [Phyllostachys edulis]